MSPRIEVLAPGSVDDVKLSYVVMGARYLNQWIFVRHRERLSWEMPAGHIEPGEHPDKAAVRELYEEAGVISSSVKVISDYSVRLNRNLVFGRLYLAEVKEIGPLPDHEMEEIRFSGKLPSHLTYPELQSLLFSLLTLR